MSDLMQVNNVDYGDDDNVGNYIFVPLILHMLRLNHTPLLVSLLSCLHMRPPPQNPKQTPFTKANNSCKTLHVSICRCSLEALACQFVLT